MVLAYLEVGKFDFFIIFIIINRVGRDSSNSYASFVLSNFLRSSYLDIRTLTQKAIVNFFSSVGLKGSV